MPVSRQRKPKKAQQGSQKPAPPRRTPTPPPATQRSGWSWLWAAIVALSVVVTIASGIVTFLPRISVDPDGSIDPKAPYPIAFKVKNDTFIKITEVHVMSGLCQVVLGPGALTLASRQADELGRCAGPLGAGASLAKVAELAGGEPLTVDVNDGWPLPVVPAWSGPPSFISISIEVIYRPWPWPITRKLELKFETRRRADGFLEWFSVPLAEAGRGHEFIPHRDRPPPPQADPCPAYSVGCVSSAPSNPPPPPPPRT